jgi:hypothetical protein
MGSDSKELLGIEPLELRFSFETKKQISCSMQLTNRTDDYIAFKVKTTSPKKYCVRPNSGIVPPRSTSDVIGYAQFSSPSCKTLGYFPRPVICVQKIDSSLHFLSNNASPTGGTSRHAVQRQVSSAERCGDWRHNNQGCHWRDGSSCSNVYQMVDSWLCCLMFVSNFLVPMMPTCVPFLV